MSVLFEALHKAAREYRSINDPVFLPIRPAQSASSRFRFLLVVYVLLGGLIGLGCGALLFMKNERASVDGNQTASVEQQINDAQDRGSAAGIVLPVESVDIAPETKLATINDVERQLAELPALADQQAANEVVSLEAGQAVVVSDQSVSSPSDLMGRADAAIKVRDWETALSLYNDQLEQTPDDRAALTGKTFVIEQSGSPDALADIESMIEDHPAFAPLHAAHARLLAEQDQPAEALAAWERAVSIDPRNKVYLLGAAILHDRLGHEVQALKAYRKVRNRDLTMEAKRRIAYLAARQRDKDLMQKASYTSPQDQDEE